MVPARAVMPVAMAIPIAAPVIVGADHQPRRNDHRARTDVRPAAAARAAMIAATATIRGNGRRHGGQHGPRRKRCEYDLLHLDTYRSTILVHGPSRDWRRTPTGQCRSAPLRKVDGPAGRSHETILSALLLPSRLREGRGVGARPIPCAGARKVARTRPITSDIVGGERAPAPCPSR